MAGLDAEVHPQPAAEGFAADVAGGQLWSCGAGKSPSFRGLVGSGFGKGDALVSKLLGAILILLSCGLAGQWAVGKLKSRVGFLTGMEQGLLHLRQEVSYTATGLGEALLSAGEAAGAAGGIFLRAGELLRQEKGLSAEEAWSRALQAQEGLEPQLQTLLCLPGQGLGLSDGESQCRHLDHCLERLQEAEQQAKQREQQYSRIYSAFGWGCGAILVLFLL